MVLHLSDGAAEDCAAQMEEYTVTPVVERSAFLYILISALTLDYIQVVGLKKGDQLHEALVVKLGKLAKVFTGESFNYAQLCRYYDSGIIPVCAWHIFPDALDLTTGDVYELPKGRVGNLITMVNRFQTEVLDGSCGEDEVKLFTKAAENLAESASYGRGRLVDGKYLKPTSPEDGRCFGPRESDGNDKDRLFNLD